jgi:hypothetical protein
MRQVLMFPEDLPATVAAARQAPTASVVLLADALTSGVRSQDRLHALLQSAPLRPPGVKLDRWEWRPQSRRTEQFAILDQFFGVSRTTADAREMFGHAAVVAYRDLLADTVLAGTGLDEVRWNELRWGLEAMARFAAGATRAESPDSPPPPGERPRDPHRRWRTGHQMFFPLVQGILVGLRCFTAAVIAGDIPAARESIIFATDTMRASARALEFAADFAPGRYSSEIRPSMTPPGTPQGLSGLMSADHHRMVTCFQEIRPVTAVLSDDLNLLYQRFVAETEQTYQAHQHVCIRFNGDKVVSLRMNHSSSMPAAEVLAQLGRARIKTLGSS